jgi:hypothetical protein
MSSTGDRDMSTTGNSSFNALLLGKAQSGERFLRLTLLSAEHGITCALLRNSASTPTAGSATDLFDLAEIRLDLPDNAAARQSRCFITDYCVVRRHTGIASDHERLDAACRLARVLTANPLPDDSAPALFSLALTAAGAFNARPRPDVTLFKSLWKIARDEGLPVFQQWLPALPAGDQLLVANALRFPLHAQTASAADIARFQTSLERWLSAEYQFVL